MGLFGSLFGKPHGQPVSHSMRDKLFGDAPLDQWPPPGVTVIEFPWSAFASARSRIATGRTAGAIADWHEIAARRGIESRHHVQAWHYLRQHGQSPPPEHAKDVLGVVVEVGLPEGLDVLAAYADHTARYWNHGGGGVVWEHADTSLDPLIDELLAAAHDFTEQIGPWTKPRPGPPEAGVLRLSFLTPSGLHFGQGSMDVFSKHPFSAACSHWRLG